MTPTPTCSRCGSTEDVAEHTNSKGQKKLLCLICFELPMRAAAKRMEREKKERGN